jgi:hypothetical protein
MTPFPSNPGAIGDPVVSRDADGMLGSGNSKGM